MSETPSRTRDKAELEKANEKFRFALNDQIRSMESDIELWSKRALIIGGALYIGYSLVQLISSKEDSNESTAQMATLVSQRESGIVRLIKQQISLFILGVARKKLLDFLNINDTEA